MQLPNRVFGFAILLLGAQGLWADNGNGPVITKVTFTFASGSSAASQMDIYGAGFGSVKPTVVVDGLTLGISLYTDQHVTAAFSAPGLAAGSYLVTLTPNSKSSNGDDSKKSVTFSATAGAPAAAAIAQFLASINCPSGTFLSGFGPGGTPVCAAPAATDPAPAPPPPGSSGTPSPAPAPSPTGN